MGAVVKQIDAEAEGRWAATADDFMNAEVAAARESDDPDAYFAIAPSYAEAYVRWALRHPEQAMAWMDRLASPDDGVDAIVEWIRDRLSIEQEIK